MAITIAGSGIVSANIANGTIVAADIADNENLGIDNFVPQGLICSNDTDASHDVAISVGGVRDATNVVNMSLAAILTKRIDAAWAVGDDAGGMDTGAVGASTGYYLWLIKRSDTGVVDMLFSLSGTSPTMPTNYDFKRLIGFVTTDASSNIVGFTHSGGDYFFYSDNIKDINDATITSETYETAAVSVPAGALAHIYGHLSNLTSSQPADGRLFINPVGSATLNEQYETFGAVETSGNIDRMTDIGFVLTDSSSQLRYTTRETSGTATVIITTIGFHMFTRSNP